MGRSWRGIRDKAKNYGSVTGAATGGGDTELLGFAKASISSSLSTTNSVTFEEGWSWTNNSNQTKWVQLGAQGYEFDYSKYTVVSPCRIMNSTKKHVKLPTNEPWLHHN